VTGYLKLTAYFDERLRHGGRFTSDALLDLYSERTVATSIVLRGIASFGPHHVLRTDQSLSMSENSPIAVTAVDEADKMAGLAEQVSAMVGRGLVTLERAALGGTGAPPAAAKPRGETGREPHSSAAT
jgi:PII-like signaling protein